VKRDSLVGKEDFGLDSDGKRYPLFVHNITGRVCGSVSFVDEARIVKRVEKKHGQLKISDAPECD